MPSRRHALRGLTAVCGLIAVLATHSWPASAADPEAHMVAGFTRQVQPLLLNKCAAGACHGGPSGHAPRFQRGHVSGQIDRVDTLANIDSLMSQVTTPEDLRSFIATISRRHPDTAANDGVRLTPITPQERATLERWLIAATGAASPTRAAASRAPRPAPTGSTAAASSTATPSTVGSGAAESGAAGSRRLPTPNRFRLMLEAAANPPMLPPPEEPQGIILGKDRDE